MNARATALALAAILIVLCAPLLTRPVPAAAAETVTAGDLVVSDAWAKATDGRGGIGVAYVTIQNRGVYGDRLVGAETPVAGRVAFRVYADTGGVVRVRRVDEIALAPDAVTALEPGARHLMLRALQGPLEEGRQFPLVLRFQRAGEISVTVEVRKAGITPPKATGVGETGPRP